ncbi:hypothetical protein LOC71_03220 [Rhodopirellula sp. JC740]|uniref:Secreted protein n=2 Tax=Rhodopirellula halodulae TaxID=2894198 RepID=A0ABS8NCK5_9BACT|nr:hypothetical protein [Rhodopirellula sp. JC740]MCC9641271.1 hypothetical protein [Rhodopirellula sp. JC740]
MSLLNRSILLCRPALVFGLAAMLSFSAGNFAVAEEAVADKPVVVDVFGAGTLEVPAEFKKTTPKSRILEHEFEVKEGEAEDAPAARLTMMAAGGDIQANLDRWKMQFSGSDKKVGEAEEKKVGDWSTHVIEVSGDFSERMGGGPFSGGRTVQRKDYGMLGAIIVHPEGRKYFVKMIGPQSVIEANRDAFKEMIATIGK